MIEIILEMKDYYRLMHRLITIEYDRPISKSIGNWDFEYILNDDIHFWFIENNIIYSLREDENCCSHIIFENISDAVLFKLVWM